MTATPTWIDGLPQCSRDDCAEYDGKRCKQMGFRPDRFCEPTLRALLRGPEWEDLVSAIEAEEDRADTAERERDAAIKALAEEGRKRGELQAQLDALRTVAANLLDVLDSEIRDLDYDTCDDDHQAGLADAANRIDNNTRQLRESLQAQLETVHRHGGATFAEIIGAIPEE